MDFEPVIGLEVHVELNTKSKIFCSCSTNFGDAPNSNVCPVCCGMPGTLPVLNEEALLKACLAGLALDGTILPVTRFDRKQYFYPDLPKGYQISQLDFPVMKNGKIIIETENGPKVIRINRLHLEEDAGKLLHSENGSLVDLNRAGVPLIEIVSEPDLSSAKEAVKYLVELRKIMKFAGVSDVNMEEGSLRCDANVSVRPVGSQKLGTRVEIKNMNSFRFAEKAIQYEIERQVKILKEGKKVLQETRLYDSQKDITVSMRSKEEAEDYRYFPEPDLLPFVFDEKLLKTLKESLPVMPSKLKAKFIEDYSLPSYDAEILSSEPFFANLFEETAKKVKNPKTVSNWIMTEIMKFLNETKKDPNSLNFSSDYLAELINSVEEGIINSNSAKEVLSESLKTGKSPLAVIKDRGIMQVSDENELSKLVDEVLLENPDLVDKYRSGKNTVFGALMGAVMKKSKGKANPQLCNKILREKLS